MSCRRSRSTPVRTNWRTGVKTWESLWVPNYSTLPPTCADKFHSTPYWLWIVHIINKLFTCLVLSGGTNQRGSLWPGKGSSQWRRCTGSWGSVSDSVLPELQEWGRGEGCLQETVGSVHEEECGFPDCWGGYTFCFILLSAQSKLF